MSAYIGTRAVDLWTGTIGSGGVADASVTTIPLSSASGLTNGAVYIFTIDRVDSNGTKTPSRREVGKGTLSGSNLINCTRGVHGTAQQHNAGAVVEVLFTATHHNELMEALEVEHNSNGTHSDITADSVISTGVIEGASLELASGATVTAILDEDNMASNSATAIPTQQSVKAYVDNNVSIPTQLNDTNGNEAIKTVATTDAVNELTVTNAATGGSPEISATGSDTNIHIAIKGKGDSLVKIAVLTQNNTTNAYKNNSVILTGWGFILGNSGVAMSESITFGITFSEAPIVVIGGAGQRGSSDPSAIGDLNAQPGYVMAETYSITTTGFSAGLSRATTGAGGAQSFSSTMRYGYNWIAVGAFN